MAHPKLGKIAIKRLKGVAIEDPEQRRVGQCELRCIVDA